MTVTAFFDNRTDAEEAVRALHAAGVSRDSIRLVPGHERDEAEGADAPSLGEASVSFGTRCGTSFCAMRIAPSMPKACVAAGTWCR